MTAHQPNDLSHLSEEEFNSLCPQGEHAPGPTITTDFRALCEELIRVNDDTDAGDWCRAWDDVTDRARAALAEQPVGPTRGEAVAVYTEVMAAHDCQTLGDMAEHFARAVLAHWGKS
jgi:hypothetical protein